jgi:tRNA threonylcarbamoyladenosine dehydratase
MEFLSRVSLNPKFQIAATAVISGATVACLILGYQSLEKAERISELKGSIPLPAEGEHAPKRLTSYGGSSRPADKEDLRNEALARRAQAGDYDDELILEQLARNSVFLTPEGLNKLRSSFIIVVGLGGVGSHCTAALARSGASKIRLIDFDQVTLSSLNRHAVATLADVGMPKVHCMQRRMLAITPWTKFDLRQGKFEEKVAAKMLEPWEDGQKPDFVIDAIDNIDTKVALLKYCHVNGLPVISSMGAGCKSDPTRIMVGDIGTSTDDGLSRATRRKLKLLGITSGIPVVYSNEKTGEGKAELLPLSDEVFQKGAVSDFGVLPNFRVRILPVLGTMPAVFGYTVANYVILSITGYPISYAAGKNRDKMYDGILGYIQGVEEKLVRMTNPNAGPDIAVGLKVPLTPGDIAFLVEELWNGRSAITGISTRVVLTRWRRPDSSMLITIGEGGDLQKTSRLSLADLVCMSKEEAIRHDTEVFRAGKRPEEVYDQEVIERVESRLKEARQAEALR